MDTKFAEQFLERVYAALHAANDSCLYMEFVRLLNDFGEKQKTSDSVPQVQLCAVLHLNLTYNICYLRFNFLFLT